jgi:hypothetical protein
MRNSVGLIMLQLLIMQGQGLVQLYSGCRRRRVKMGPFWGICGRLILAGLLVGLVQETHAIC